MSDESAIPDVTKQPPTGKDAAQPRQPPYGQAENYGSPGGDEPPPSDDPGRGTPGEARERS